MFAVLVALGQEPEHPLRPPDRSSPRAALKTFLDGGDGFGAFLARDYLPSPSRAEYNRLLAQTETLIECLDLGDVPPASRGKTGRAAALALYEILSRIQLPAVDAIPDATQLPQPAGTNAVRWVIPNTEIVLRRVPSGPRQGEFLFSPQTVADAEVFFQRVRPLPYARPVPLENLRKLVTGAGGWMIPHRWIQTLPAWMQAPLANNPLWKWIGLALVLGVYAALLRVAFRLSRRVGGRRPFLRALAAAGLPAFLMLATPAAAYLALVQLGLFGQLGSAIQLGESAVMFLAGTWICWRLAPVFAEAVIPSATIHAESIDAHLIRICARLLGIIAGAGLLALGAERMGVPLYGIVAGLGVGGLAIALAAQTTIENLIGGLSLFADKPIRVGDFCRYGEEVGTVEDIGIRSTRIRGLDRTVTTIPNATLSKMPVVNFALRDRMLLKAILGVRRETSPEQLRHLLIKIRELLLVHPRIHPEGARARFIGYGTSSLDLEVFAYVTTGDWPEFLGIQEEILLRLMELIRESGTALALPAQTVHFTQDDGLDANRTSVAEAQIRTWREQGDLPFPDFSPEQKQRLQGSAAHPHAETADGVAK